MTDAGSARIRRTPKMLVSVAAGALLAGVVPGVAAAAYKDMGTIQLQLAPAIYAGSPQLVYTSPNVGAMAGAQSFVISSKCNAALAASPELAVMKQGPAPFTLGYGVGSLGVADGPKGVACYRISSSAKEWLQFDLGSFVKTQDARSIYKLELDMEVKQNAKFELEMTRGGALTGKKYVLESGSSRGTTPVGYAVEVKQCQANSDSGPDAGALDNCQWTIDLTDQSIGDGFRLTAMAGEGSVEDGSDWAAAAAGHKTLIYLTDVMVGALGCEAANEATKIGTGVVNAACSVVRVDPGKNGDPTAASGCMKPVAYVFKTGVDNAAGLPNGCELLKDASGQQLAAVIDITFPPEPSSSTQQTKIRFEGQADGTDDFTPGRCVNGTLIPDANGDGTKNDPTIREVLSRPSWVTDVVPDTDTNKSLEWACILEETWEYIGNLSGTEQIQIRQRILFWGDISWTRF